MRGGRSAAGAPDPVRRGAAVRGASAQKTSLLLTPSTASWFYTRSPIACGRVFVRAQSAIRADGTPAAQARSRRLDASTCVGTHARAAIARSRAPTVFSGRMKSTSIRKTRFWVNARAVLGFIQDRRLCTDVLFIRAQSMIRADGRRPRKFDHYVSMCRLRLQTRAYGHCPLSRANRVFLTDEKHIRQENTVIVNTEHCVGVLYKIANL